MKTENQKTKEDTQADYAEFLYDVLEKVQKGQIIFAQAVYLIDEAAKVKYATQPAQESSDAVEFAGAEIKLFSDVLDDIKDWEQYNRYQIESFDGSEAELQKSIADNIKARIESFSIFLKEKGAQSWEK